MLLQNIGIFLPFYTASQTFKTVIFTKTEMGRTCSTMGERRDAYRVLMVKPEGRRPLGTPRRRWEDNIKMDF
jgi:hypothetical protein